MLGRALFGAVALLMALPSPRAACAQDYFGEGNGVPAEWNEVASGYMSDPAAHRDELLAIAREAGDDLPPQFLVLVADAHLRSGRPGRAEAILKEALAAEPDPLWHMFATLGLGGARMMRGDPDGAAVYFETITTMDQDEGWAHAIGSLGLGHARLTSDRPMDAKAAFDAAAANGVVDDQFRFAGKFGSAMALYESGDLEAAAEAFDELAAADPDGPFGRDARFAAARARLEAGDRTAALDGLEAAVARCDPDEKHRGSTRRLRNLDPRALGREWLRNYRTMSWKDSMARETTMYTIGGCDLARATLREVRAAEGRVQPVSAAVDSPAVPAEAPAAAPGSAPKQGAPRPQAPSPAPEAPSSGWMLWAGAAALAAAVIFLRLRGRRAGGAA
jgi:tetratricopeptide (TPR) repeat protein